MVITEEFIRSLTYPEYFDRGMGYFKRKRVTSLDEDEDTIKARVRGTKSYKVVIDKHDLEMSCDCMAFSGKHICKHIVAVLLVLAKGRKVGKTTKIKLKKKKIKDSKIIDSEILTTNFKTLVRSQHRYLGRWDVYFDRQLEILCQGLRIISKISRDENGLRWALDTAKWYDQELTKIDDSDGTNQDLQWKFFFEVVKISDGIDGNKIWKIWEEYLGKEYNFDFKDNLIELTFRESKNRDLVEMVGKKCDMLDDSFWVRSRSYWCQRLLKTKDKRFEERAISYSANNVNILLMLLDFYKSKDKLDRVIELAWPKRGHFLVGDWLVKNLNANEHYEKLMILREERLTKLFNKEDLRQLRELCKKYKSSEWEQTTERLIKNTSDRHGLIDLAMFLGRYDLAVTALTTILDYPLVDLDDYASKLAVLDTNSGIKLYRLLVEREISKMRSSNYYKNFWHYIDELRRLKDKKVVDVLRPLLVEYPTKTKLIEGIKQRYNNLQSNHDDAGGGSK